MKTEETGTTGRITVSGTTSAYSKVCPMCHRELTLDHFYSNKGRAKGVATYCKPCYRDKTNYNRALKREGKE